MADYTIKTLRFTFITKCQEANIPEHIIQKWVGHEIGSQVTKKVYTKVRQQAEVENINIYNKILNWKLNSNSTHFFSKNKNDTKISVISIYFSPIYCVLVAGAGLEPATFGLWEGPFKW